MVTFTLSQSVWLNRVPCVPAWSMCQRAKVPNACQHLIFKCQCANKRTKGVNIGGGGEHYQIFQFFEFFNFAQYQQISRIFGNSRKQIKNSRETNNLKFYICKISLRKYLVNVKPLMSFSMEHVVLTEQLFGQSKIELNIFFMYLIQMPCVKRTIYKSIHHAHHKFCWKRILHVN